MGGHKGYTMNTTDERDLDQIEVSIAEATKMVEFSDALIRLQSNADWKRIITEDFFADNVVRLVNLKAAPHCQDDQNQKFVIAQIDAVGQFNQYLNAIRVQGNSARKALVQDSEERENILTQE